METKKNIPLRAGESTYNYASKLFRYEKMQPKEVIEALVEKGFDEEAAYNIVFDVQQMHQIQNERAKKDMLYGALWFAGGLVATLANFGLLFWGAILFGGFLFFRGLMNADINL